METPRRHNKRTAPVEDVSPAKKTARDEDLCPDGTRRYACLSPDTQPATPPPSPISDDEVWLDEPPTKPTPKPLEPMPSIPTPDLVKDEIASSKVLQAKLFLNTLVDVVFSKARETNTYSLGTSIVGTTLVIEVIGEYDAERKACTPPPPKLKRR